jgi:uncharacterized membrane protein YgcG
MRAGLSILLLAVLLSPRLAAAEEERIVSFESRVEVRADGSLAVTETIAVVAAGDKIQRGIYRDFPTVYDGPYGTRVVVPFRVVSVERDGRKEAYHLEKIERGERVYFGKKSILVEHGPHTYVLRYETSRQLGFFPEHDELYWNVTGNGWNFPIERAAATVVLPSGVPRQSLRLEGYTGPAGAKGRALRSRVDAGDGTLRFETTAPLDPYEGLTIVASFAKGFVREPTREERRAELLRANPVIPIGAAGLALLLAYYSIAWLLVGRDPKRGTIIPRFEPPLGFAPACLRYVREMGYDERCFTAALVSMAAKGWITIEEKDGEYALVRGNKPQDGRRPEALSISERQLSSRLLSGRRLELESKNHTKVSGAIRALRDTLALEYEGKLFLAHRRWLVPGLVLSSLCVIAAGLSGDGGQNAAFLFMCVWLSGWSFGTFAVAATAVRAWRALFAAHRRGAFAVVGALISVLFTMLFAVPMLGGLGFGIYFLSMATSVWIAPLLLGLIGVNYLFLLLLKQPTQAGRAVMDEIEGFKMYLETAEGDEIAALAGPPKTRELFERMLPYAIALDVENRWAEKFSDVLAAAAADDGSGRNGYHPAWYSGDSWSRVGTASMLSSFGSSLSGAVSSASTAPGSSSGGGGGGSSGGGGGGGGGGGW